MSQLTEPKRFSHSWGIGFLVRFSYLCQSAKHGKKTHNNMGQLKLGASFISTANVIRNRQEVCDDVDVEVFDESEKINSINKKVW